ncbi:hypothetical protein DL764_007405 [Monosporascus ibericus]|uniref:DUF7703 domain-containing protein n=1 Tax=Monosporascus ibericus TaxID=155417 RepID=A0A4Q4T0W1_9PEZI|nr:hypothetical protein DL764_007405 [Monosporascus ibericus]
MAVIGVSDSIAIARAMTAFMAIAFYNVLELTVILFSFFERKSGLYFWSFFLATWGIFFHTLGFLTYIFGIIKSAPGWMAIAIVGWIPMVTGQSLVLYSRLHLVEGNRLVLRLVLGMIITNFFICHIPTIIISYGRALAADSAPYDAAYTVYEKVQMTMFATQEVIISSLYLWNLYKSRHKLGALHGAQVGKTLRHLAIVNVVVIMLDVLVLVLEYIGLYNMQNVIKGAVYSIKLKLEFIVLNKLINLVKGGRNTTSGGTGTVSSQAHQYARSANRGDDINLDEVGKSKVASRQYGGSGNGSKIYERTSEAAVDNSSINRENESIEVGASDLEGEILPSCSSQDGFAKRAF